MWTKDDINVVVDDFLTSDPVVTATIETPDGNVMVMAEVIVEEDGQGNRDLDWFQLKLKPV